MATEIYGKLLIVGKKDKSELEFPLDKKSILIGRSVDGSWKQNCILQAVKCIQMHPN